MATNDNVITIFTDGACRGNPGPGGWGAVLIYQEHTKTISGGESNTTNNRMELMAVIMALEALKKPSQVIICTDSQYTKNGMTQWMSAWKARNWKTSDNKPVKNKELWQRLENAAQQHTITWKWVKGHSGLAGNEQADELARRAIPDTYNL